MDLLMNGLLLAGTLFAGCYCWVLGRRVQDLKSLDKGLGGSIVTLTRQIELARLTLDEARNASKENRQDLAALVGRADAAANQLRLLIAAAPERPVALAEPAPAPRPRFPAPPPLVAEPPAAILKPEPPLVAEPVRPTAPGATASEASVWTAPLAEPVATPIAEPSSAPAAASFSFLPEPPVAEARAAAANLAAVPKPRALMPIENPLRRIGGKRPAAPEPSHSEDEILEALTALAGGRDA